MENLQRSAYARELLLKVSESRYWISLQRENDRLHFARQSSQTWSMLALLIEDFDRIFLLQYDENTVRLGAGFRRLTEGHSDALTTENWLSAIAPEDRPVLLDSMRPDPGPNAQKPTTLSLQMYGRGSLQARPLTVHVMRFMFMNKPLVIVLTDSPQIQTNLTV